MSSQATQKPVNPYAPPKTTNLETEAPDDGEPPFFPVSLLKLGVMAFFTFGIYEIYWGYKHWKCVNRRYGERNSAGLLGFFIGVSAYWLFRRIRDYAARHEVGLPAGAGVLAVAFLVMSLLGRMPDPFWLISMFAFTPLLVVQNTVNKVNAIVTPEADPNSRFGAWNILGIVLGVMFWGLVLFGMLAQPAG